jgi:hypothetical protein
VRLSLRHLLQQRLRLLQIARVEALREPPVNRSKQFARLLHLASWSRQRRARLIAARSSQDFACCARATVSARSKYVSAFATFRSGDINAISPTTRLTSASHQFSFAVFKLIMPYRFYTIGHSTRSIDQFVDLLDAAEIRLVVDIRTAPWSRTNPLYNLEILPKTLSQFQIEYEHIPTLGGLRGRRRDVPADVNGYWLNQSFHNYADYAMSTDFHSGLIRLLKLGHATQCAIMCAEAVWWQCHRRIIADYLIAAGEIVFHILGRDHVEQAQMTEGAKLGSTGMLTYPADVG